MTPHDPGGRALPLPPGIRSRAIFGGPGGCYRYELEWAWDPSRPALLFLGMNPSTASHLAGDATVAKMHRLARGWGHGKLLVGNASAYRCTDQSRLAEVPDPVGPLNAAHVLAMAQEAVLIVVGYGKPKHAACRAHGPALCRLLVARGFALHAVRVLPDNTPGHPLYLKEQGLLPVPWRPD